MVPAAPATEAACPSPFYLYVAAPADPDVVSTSPRSLQVNVSLVAFDPLPAVFDVDADVRSPCVS